jgi:LPXTG-site transpeptidase (sortase) family protein
VVAIIATAVALGGGAHSVGSITIGATSSPTTTLAPSGSLPGVATASSSLSPSASPPAVVARRIRITRLGIDLRIVEGDGVDAPMNKAAHYPGTGWPTGGTNIYIYAHAQKGMFLNLWDAKVGDQILLDLVDGSTRTYTVTIVKPKVAWNALQYVDPTPTEQLTLQTSTSNYPTAPRFIVIAMPTI